MSCKNCILKNPSNEIKCKECNIFKKCLKNKNICDDCEIKINKIKMSGNNKLKNKFTFVLKNH